MTTTERAPYTDSGQPTSDSGILGALEGAQPCDGVDSRVWIGQVADEFTAYIPDQRGSGNKLALLAALNLCAWTAPQPHTACTTTDVELLLAHLKGQDSSLDTAISSDVERAVVVSSDPLLTVTEILPKPRTAAVRLKYVWSDSNRLPTMVTILIRLGLENR